MDYRFIGDDVKSEVRHEGVVLYDTLTEALHKVYRIKSGLGARLVVHHRECMNLLTSVETALVQSRTAVLGFSSIYDRSPDVSVSDDGTIKSWSFSDRDGVLDVYETFGAADDGVETSGEIPV